MPGSESRQLVLCKTSFSSPPSNGELLSATEQLSGGREQVEGRLQLLLHSPPSSNPISTLLERLGLNSSSFCSIGFCEPSLITLKLMIFITEYPEVYGGHFHTSSPLLLTHAHLVEAVLEQCMWHSPVAATALWKVRYQISFS